MTTPRFAHTATLLPGGKVLVAGGYDGLYLASAEVYDPASGTWTATGPLATPRAGHTATLLPTGKVLVVGGFDGSAVLASAEVYDPSSGTWTATGTLAAGARLRHTATLLPSGQVLVAGGESSGGVPIPSAELYDPASGTWTSTLPLATPRRFHIATLLPSGKVLAAGGESLGAVPIASAELYDPATGAWTSTGPLATPRRFHAATLLATGEVLAAGGEGLGGPVASAELYHPSSETWTSTGPLATPRYDHTSTLLPSGEVLVAGGSDTGGYLASAEVYDPVSGMWTATGSLSAPRADTTATLLPSGDVLVAGGRGPGVALASAEFYDPSNGTWTATGLFATPRYYHTATLLPSGDVLAAAGYDTGVYLASAELYDPASGSWTATGPLATPRTYYTATLMPTGKVLVAGGESLGAASIASAELYDPVSETWTGTGPLTIPREFHTATLLPSGKVLVAGGFSNGVPLASAEIYDPASGTWTAAGSLAIPRQFHTATLLPSGKVLVVAGYNGVYVASAELYDPATGTWTAAGSLAIPRDFHVATLLPNGKVLVAGGYNGGPLASAQLYDPGSGTWTATASLATPRYYHTSTLLPNGKVLVAGGSDGGPLASVEIYDPPSATWAATGSFATPRYYHTSTLLPNGKLLVAGGFDGVALASAELYDLGTFPDSRRPIVTTAPATITYGVLLPITGTGFRGDSEAAGGGRNSSAVNYPLAQLRSLLNGQVSWLLPDPRTSFWDDPMTLTFSSLPDTLMPGASLLSVIVDGVPSLLRPIDVACSVVITQQPVSQVVPIGGVATFTVATQGGRSFQWRKDGISIPGATEPSYTTPPVTGADSGSQYSVVVQGLCGTAADTQTSSPATLTVADAEPPTAAVLSPSGGEYLLLSDPGSPPNTHLVTWSMSDNIRICKVDVSLMYSNDGSPYVTAPPGGGLPASFGPGGTCVYPGEDTTSVLYTIPTTFPSGVSGSLYKIQVVVTDHIGLQTTVVSPNPFYIVQSNPDSVRTLILSNTWRMQTQMGIPPAEAAALDVKLHELADHPRVLGFVVDLNGVTQLTDLYAAWDADPADTHKANAVLFGCHAPLPSGCAAERDGIHDVVRTLLDIYSGVKYVVLVGDDRIIPMGRVTDRTVLFLESNYPAGGDLTPTGTTVGQALAVDTYLSDDPLAVRDATRPDELSNTLYIPDVAIGRLVETPVEITTTIATFISQDGILDLSVLDPLNGHKVLVTGYDFLSDSAVLVRERWENVFGISTPEEPVDGVLVGGNWGYGSVAERRAALRAHLDGNGEEHYGVASLSGHATHFEEGVPGSGAQGPGYVVGLPASEIYGVDACGTPSSGALDLAGGVVYAAGCHGGLPVAGSCATDLENSLDLPQTFLSRGVVAYVANSGYGWGLIYGVGYGERLMRILTEEMTSGGTIVTGEAVVRTKLRYFMEQPSYDAYDEKSLMQWTFFGLPMYAVRTGIPGGGMLPFAGPAPRPEQRPEVERIGAVSVARSMDGGVPPPPFLMQLTLGFDFTASGIYEKRDAAGNPVLVPGCPNPLGCYYTLNGLSLGKTDLPIQPYLVYDSRLSGTSQHGVLWKGGVYDEETDWVPVEAELASNGGDGSNHGSAPLSRPIGPHAPRYLPGEDPPDCRPNDLELNSVVVVAGEDLKDQMTDLTYSTERHYRTIDLEVLYFNNSATPEENCDRLGPGLGIGPYAGQYHQLVGTTIEWAVRPSDSSGVWRVLVVANDNTVDGQGRGTWSPVELTDDGTGTWRGSRPAGSPRVTYVIQAVDNRGNVTWLDYVMTQLPSSGVDPGLPNPVDVYVVSGPLLSIGNAAVTEGDAGTADATFTVSLSAAASQTVSVSYATAPGSALAGVDYTHTAGTLSFAPGETSRSFAVSVIGDIEIETDEGFLVGLGNPVNAGIATAQGLGTIVDDDAPSLSSNELVHGSDQVRDLAAMGPTPGSNYFRINQAPRSSWEVVIDSASGDVVPVILERLAADNATVLQTGTAVRPGGSSVSLRWENATGAPILNQHLRVRSGDCTTTCGPQDLYRIRARDTTQWFARFNNSASQISVIVLDNPTDATVTGHIWFHDAAGILRASQAFALAERGSLTLNTAGWVPGISGSIRVTSDGGYGALQGKAVAVEASTGFTFDTELLPRPR